MRAGQLDRRITIEGKSGAKDPEYGTDIDEYVPVFSRVPAQVLDELPSKAETVSNGVHVNTSKARVRIRYMEGITPEMRVIVHGKTDRAMHIVSGPAEIGRREWLEMMVTAYSK
jgi:head-tail adaptor